MPAGSCGSGGLAPTAQAALAHLRDTVGVRVICAFQDDVYQMARWLEERPAFAVLQTKDYISRPKENGYRSYHLILGILDGPGKGATVEVQLRTIATDCWASLEHQIKYKRQVPHEGLVREELKRCADEIASVDLPWRPSGNCWKGHKKPPRKRRFFCARSGTLRPPHRPPEQGPGGGVVGRQQQAGGWRRWRLPGGRSTEKPR